MSPLGRRLAVDAATALLAIAGVTLVVVGGSPPPPLRSEAEVTAGQGVAEGPPAPTDSAGHPAAAPTAATPTPDEQTAPGGGTTTSHGMNAPRGAQAAPLGRSEPVHLAIPAIGVNTALIPLGLNPDGTIAVPPLGRTAPAGWYRYLATPGEVGPAVLLGHVDSARDGPAVFFRLAELRAGDAITVRRADGRTAAFTVTRVEEYPKEAFPTETVYGGLDHPGLRLVTCGGTYDKIRRQYRGNVVAYAEYAGSGTA
jgi:hypothetical protein